MLAAFSGATITLRFLQLTCEGHNLEFQEFLRDQHSNPVCYNLVADAVGLLMSLQLCLRFAIDNRVMDILPLLLQTINFITECV